MAASADRKALLDGYKDVELRPGLYSVDVLGDGPAGEGANSEWRRLGERLAQRLLCRDQSAVLVSTLPLDHYLLDNGQPSTATAAFEHDGKRYLVTELPGLAQVLPDVLESEEFIFGLNVWLCCFGEPQTCARALCQDTTFVCEMKRVISNLNVLGEVQLTLELIAAVSDGCQMFWFNPQI